VSAPQRLVLHAHCYQPPREEPWLELVPREPSAAPDHDWNARITRECYAPLGMAPVLADGGRIRRVINCWEWLSFNVGPTLVHWLERHAPAVLRAMVAGDRAAVARTGHGTAIAAPYHHVILPLASRRDKETEVRWGIAEFRRTFGRAPRGMWLPETAVDEETLEVLAAAGIAFTILAPHQVSTPDPLGAPLTWHGGGRELVVVPYHGALSHGVAFGDLLTSAEWFHQAIRDDREGALTVIATDGETFGHHHRFGDLAVAALLDRVTRDAGIEVTSLEAIVSDAGPRAEAHLIPDTSWSCPHGLGRWREDCGCRMDANTSQRWRAPLRAGLQSLSTALGTIIARDWPGAAGQEPLLLAAAGPELDGAGDRPAAERRLLELERHRLAMFTSCGWFFDDLARIEPRIVLRHAARALDLLAAADREPLEAALLAVLAGAHANDPADGTGDRIWREQVLPGRRAEACLAAGLLALRDLGPDAPLGVELPVHEWHLSDGGLVLRSRRTGTEHRWRGEVITHGVVATRVHVRRDDQATDVVDAEEFPEPIRQRLAAVAAQRVYGVTLHGEAQRAFAAGELSAEDARRAALGGALERLAVHGPESGADILVHGVLDLHALAEAWPTREERGAAWQVLAALPDSPARARLADRLGLVF